MRILVIDDHKMVATSLKMSLERENSISVDIINVVNELYINDNLLKYDLILLDINLTGMEGTINGLDLAQKIIETYPNIKIVILTAYKLDFYVKRAKKIGCRGFISKEEDTIKLISDIKKIVNTNETIFIKSEVNIEPLTDYEMEIIKLYSKGLTRKELSRKLHTNVRSLAVSLSRIYQKLNVRNYQEMVIKVRELGYVDPF